MLTPLFSPPENKVKHRRVKGPGAVLLAVSEKSVKTSQINLRTVDDLGTVLTSD